MCSFSEFLTAPEMMETVMSPSFIASMSFSFPSAAMGHMTMSAMSPMVRILSWVSRRETSHPPQAAAQ